MYINFLMLVRKWSDTLSMSGHFGTFIKKFNKTERIFMDFNISKFVHWIYVIAILVSEMSVDWCFKFFWLLKWPKTIFRHSILQERKKIEKSMHHCKVSNGYIFELSHWLACLFLIFKCSLVFQYKVLLQSFTTFLW